MNHITASADRWLLEEIARLEHDICDFEHRAELRKSALESEDRFSPSDPLYQRLTSIRDNMRVDLRRAKSALETRRRNASPRLKGPLSAFFAALAGTRT